jgi:molecular chaperone GrpE
MEPLETTNDENSEFDADDAGSVDEFIRELEEKEKDLDISADLVIEVGDSEVEHDNIHNSFLANVAEFGFPDAGRKVDKQEPRENLSAQNASNEDLEKAISERDDFRDSLQRQKRDFNNYRQRTERERNEMYQGILGNLASQILPVLDNLNRALDATSKSEHAPSEKNMTVFFEGIVLVNQQLNDMLSGMGVVPIPSVGEPFDPNIHEAVATEQTSECPPSTVTQELLRGYRIDDKVIRASMVKVSVAPANISRNEPPRSSQDEPAYPQETE